LACLADERHDEVEVAVDVLHTDEPLGGVHLDLVEGDRPDVVRRIAVIPLDLDVADGVGVGFGRSDTLHLVDAVLEEAVVAADRRAELLRPSGELLDLDGEELRLVVVHPLTLLRVIGEVPLAHLHEVPEAVGRPLDALGVRAPELIEVLLHELAVVGQSGVNGDDVRRTDAEQPSAIPPLVAVHVGRETLALLTPIVVVLVVVVVAVYESADREEVSDGRSRRRFHPVIEHLTPEVTAVACAVHGENRRLRPDLCQPNVHGTTSVAVLAVVRQSVLVVGVDARLLEVPLPCTGGVVFDVLAPLLAETSLPERLFHDLLDGDRVSAELVGAADPRSGEVDDVDLPVLAALELQELLLRDSATAVIALLVVELVAVGRENAVERAHRADSMGHDGDGVARLREADVLRRHRREVGLPGVLTRLGREPRLDDVGERSDVAVRTREGLGLLEGRNESLRVVEGHCGRLRFLSFHRDTPFPFLGFWGLCIKRATMASLTNHYIKN